MSVFTKRLMLGATVAATCMYSPAQDASQPFSLRLGVEGIFLTGHKSTEGSHVVKTGSDIYLGIVTTNTSRHSLSCMRVTNYVTNLDPAYQYDVRDVSGSPVGKHAIDAEPLVGAFRGMGCTFKPGESSTSGGNLITKLYDLSQPGDYTIQVSQPVSSDPNADVVKSNTLEITVTDDDALIERATSPFVLMIAGYSDGHFGYTDNILETDSKLDVKAGAEIGINIEKKNTSKHDIDCFSAWSNLSGLDEGYQYDLRDANGEPVAKRGVQNPLPFTRGPGAQVCKPGETGASNNIILTRAYDLSRPGKYTVQVSQAAPGYGPGVVKSNTIKISVAP
ncbi:MAG TPA: hypothetical protein VEK33_14390 [Terriglobales bacterium]|nr:hypothetical protein [Terriglobales bacterium]